MDWSLPGSSERGNYQAKILEWLPFPSPGDLPDPRIKPTSPALGSIFFTTEPPGKPNPIYNSRVFHFHPSQKHLQNAHLYAAPVGRGCVTERGPYGTRGAGRMDGGSREPVLPEWLKLHHPVASSSLSSGLVPTGDLSALRQPEAAVPEQVARFPQQLLIQP